MNNVLTQTELTLRARGHELSMADSAFGWFTDSSPLRDDMPALRARLEADGYLFLPGFHSRAEVVRARQVITERLQHDGYTDPAYPADDAVVVERLKIVNEKSAFRPP